ncbi:MAG: aminopeptidase [Thermodesulfobacteriaceae bacterium]|nr:aminopeptidase [Thermodesulfobacteriaceae bacterium]
MTEELEKTLIYEAKHVLEKLGEEEKKELEKLSKEYIEFLSEVKTERECVEYFTTILEKKGFKENQLERGYFVYRNKFLACWKLGRNPLTEGLRIIVSHIDTPRLDLKLHPLFEEINLAFLKTHYYGGIKKYHWVAKPLALHGTVVKKGGEVVKIVIGENKEDPVFTVCDLLPHLAKKIQGEKKLTEAIPGEKLNLLFGGIPLKNEVENKEVKEKIKLNVLKILNESYGLKEEDFVLGELQVVPAGSAREVGIDRAFIGGYGQDDRICAFTSFKAFLEVEDPEYTNLVLFMDREEIGSEGNTSAKSRIFEKMVYFLMKELKLSATPDNFFEVMSKTKAISADVTAGIDPNYLEVHDKLNDAKMGCGVAVSRYTGHGGKYMASEAHVEFLAWLLENWDKEGVVYQVVSMGKVDEGGGGTVSKHFASYGLDIVDAGPPLLSMHSPFEISHKADLYMTYKGFKVFLKI